ncbi:S-adenosyl-L-methionine-dependent methyltransferase, partial [Blyttiomyces helicus]
SYYAQFVHQQNMLQDTVRTSMYHQAIIANGPNAFRGKTVVDVGAGSGILSYFAVQAGAEKVYAVEASGMAKNIRKMVDAAPVSNPWMKGRVDVVAAKVEEAEIPRVDTLISEPIGVLLVHERMLESYLYARDNFLKPGGTMIPSTGTIFLAPFTDATLWTQTMAKVRFWEQSNFYGVNFATPLSTPPRTQIDLPSHSLTLRNGQPVVGNFDSRILLAPSCSHFVDFQTVTSLELQDITIPISWSVPFTGKGLVAEGLILGPFLRVRPRVI